MVLERGEIMASSYGGTIKLQGETDYKKALKDITNNLKVMASEMKLTASEFSKSDDAMENAKNISKSLNKQIDQQVQTIMGLEEALSMSKVAYGENSKETANWQSKLNVAKAELNNLNNKLEENERNMKDLEEATDDLGDELDDGSKKASMFGDMLKANLTSSAIIGGVKALGSAIATVGKAFGSIGKQAIDSFAEYEQLVGGVDTLFEESSTKLQEYANVAYKTAGLSANQYMETATSFSASLIQALDGDTQKVTEATNLAIIDMADNANKMGTSMEMIQNAYQGFAKQNYTMLDNLKLGYGGTKTEMERLLADATAISGIEYDISNLNDVFQAIHVIQTELEITGTTSKEATETISGSLSAMKSAWQNVLTGIGADNGNLSELINNLVDSVLVFGENILPIVENVINGIVQVIMGLSSKIVERLPQILETGMQLLQTLLNGIMTMLPQLVPIVFDIITSFVDFITQNLPMILETGVNVLFALMEGIAEALPDLVPQIVNIIIKIMEVFNENFNTFLMLGIKIILGLIEGLIKSIPDILKNLPTIIMAIINFFTLSKFISLGKTVIDGLTSGLTKTLPELLSEIPKLVGKMINSFKNGGWSGLGKDIIRGICSGLTSMGNFIWESIKSVGNSMLGGIKSFFGIKSPSRLMKDEVGTYLAEGIGVGFEDTMADVSDDMANAIPTDFDTSINASMSTNSSSSSNNYLNMVGAFKQALAEMKIELDDEVAGRFVENTVTNLVYS